jgi:putative transposase
MRQLNGVYTQLFNNWHGRTGHLFQGRYKAILIQKDSHLLEVCRYVVLATTILETIMTVASPL